MISQTKTIKTPQFISPQLTVIPQQEEGQSQIGGVSGNQFVPYDSHNPMVTQSQFHEPFLFPVIVYTPTIRDLWFEMPTFYRNSVIGVTVITLGIVAGFIIPSLSAALERLLQ